MLRFIKHNLTSIDGVSIYPIISLLIFFLFFAFMLTYVIRMKKNEVSDLSNIPFETNAEGEIQNEVGF
jgi:cytochrome c oxidase cbb3-type subunit IV